MAEKRKSKSKKKEQLNVPLLLTVLAVCIVAVVVISIVIKNEDETADTDPVSDLTDEISEAADSSETDKSDDANADSEADVTVNAEPNDTDEATDTASDDTEANTDEFDYTVETETETKKTENGEISIIYPTIVDSDGESDKSELLNQLIKQYMDQKFKYEGIESESGGYVYEITDTITALSTDSFVSIIVKGQYYIQDASSPTLFTYTINCDLTSTDIVPASELVYDFSAIKSLFIDGKFTLADGYENLLAETNYEDMIMEYRSEYGIYPSVYFTEDSFGMVIDLVYTLGGYAMFEIPYSYVTDYVFCP